MAGGQPIKKEEELDIDKVQHNYKNLKSQCWFILANHVNSGMIGVYKGVPNDIRRLMTEDLEQMKQVNADKDGKLQVITKEEIKEKGGLTRSTDCGDALMMRIYFELEKGPKFIVMGRKF